MSQPQAQLSKVVNLPELVKAFADENGVKRQYQIRRFNLGQLAQALEWAGFIGVLVVQAMKLGTKPTEEELISFVAQGIGVSSPAFLPIISIATQEPLEWLSERDQPEDLIDAARIFVKAVVKNKDFFTPENIEGFKTMFAELVPATPTSGGTSSTTSSTEDTTTTPS
jgi:hypothetical protein